MNSAAEEQKQRQAEVPPPTLLKMADFKKVLRMANGNLEYTEAKIIRELSPKVEHDLVVKMMVDLEEFVMELVGSDDAFDDIIFKARNKRVEASQQPLQLPQTLNQVTHKEIKKIVSAANSSMKSFFTEKLLGKTDKNNVFTVLSSVKEGIKNHIDSSNK